MNSYLFYHPHLHPPPSTPEADLRQGGGNFAFPLSGVFDSCSLIFIKLGVIGEPLSVRVGKLDSNQADADSTIIVPAPEFVPESSSFKIVNSVNFYSPQTQNVLPAVHGELLQRLGMPDC